MPLEIRGTHFLIRSAQLVRKTRLEYALVLVPLPLTVSCSSKIQIGFTFLVPAHPGSPGQRTVKRVCVCVWRVCVDLTHRTSERCQEQDRITAVGSIHNNLVKIGRVVPEICSRHTDRKTRSHNTLLAYRSWSRPNNLKYNMSKTLGFSFSLL